MNNEMMTCWTIINEIMTVDAAKPNTSDDYMDKMYVIVTHLDKWRTNGAQNGGTKTEDLVMSD